MVVTSSHSLLGKALLNHAKTSTLQFCSSMLLHSLLIRCSGFRAFQGTHIFRNSRNFSMAPPVLSLGRVLSIQSHTVQGYVGNKSAVFPLQLLGYDVDPISSVQFSNHTGYPTFKGQVLNGQQLWDIIEGLEANDLLYYTHLLTGYIRSVSFLSTILEVINKLRSINPNLTYVWDPMMADEGKLYVPTELVSMYRDKTQQDGREACNSLHATGPSKGHSPEQFTIMIPKIPAYFSKYPDNLANAAELAVSSLQALFQRTVNDYKSAGHDSHATSLEIRLIQSQDDIRSPQVKFRAEIYS